LRDSFSDSPKRPDGIAQAAEGAGVPTEKTVEKQGEAAQPQQGKCEAVKKQLRLPERAVLLGQKVKYLLLAWLVALYVTRQGKIFTQHRQP